MCVQSDVSVCVNVLKEGCKLGCKKVLSQGIEASINIKQVKEECQG